MKLWSRAKARWTVDVRDSVEGLEAEWRALMRADNATPFQQYGLMRQFYRQLAVNRSAEPVVALVRNAGGEPVAIFPMMRVRKHGLSWLRTDARPLDYCAPIVDASLSPAEAGEIAMAVAAAVPRADIIYCNKMPAHFGGTANPLVALPNAGRLRLSAWSITLAGRTPQDLVEAQAASFRKKMRKHLRKMNESYRRSFRIAVGAEITKEDYDAFREMRSNSFREKGRSNILDDEEWLPFYDALVKGEAGDCQAWLAVLEADGKPVAFLLGFLHGRTVQGLMPASLLGEWLPFRLGLQLKQDVLLHFQQAGADVFDMSIGDMQHKRHFGCDELALHDAMFPGTWRGLAYYWFWRLKIKIRSRIK